MTKEEGYPVKPGLAKTAGSARFQAFVEGGRDQQQGRYGHQAAGQGAREEGAPFALADGQRLAHRLLA